MVPTPERWRRPARQLTTEGLKEHAVRYADPSILALATVSSDSVLRGRERESGRRERRQDGLTRRVGISRSVKSALYDMLEEFDLDLGVKFALSLMRSTRSSQHAPAGPPFLVSQLSRSTVS